MTNEAHVRHHVCHMQGKMVLQLAKEQSARLLKHVVRCYLRLSDNPRAREALRQCLPDQLKDQTFNACLKDESTTKKWLALLIKNLEVTPGMPVGGPGLGGPVLAGPGAGAPSAAAAYHLTSALGMGGIPMPPQ